MMMSNVEAFRIAFVPGAAESLKKQAMRSRNRKLIRTVSRLNETRDAFYICTAVTAVSAIGAAVLNSPPVIAVIGLGLTTIVAKKLYDESMVIKYMTIRT